MSILQDLPIENVGTVAFHYFKAILLTAKILLVWMTIPSMFDKYSLWGENLYSQNFFTAVYTFYYQVKKKKSKIDFFIMLCMKKIW